MGVFTQVKSQELIGIKAKPIKIVMGIGKYQLVFREKIIKIFFL